MRRQSEFRKSYPLNDKNGSDPFLKGGIIANILKRPFHIDVSRFHIVNYKDWAFVLGKLIGFGLVKIFFIELNRNTGTMYYFILDVTAVNIPRGAYF